MIIYCAENNENRNRNSNISYVCSYWKFSKAFHPINFITFYLLIHVILIWDGRNRDPECLGALSKLIQGQNESQSSVFSTVYPVLPLRKWNSNLNTPWNSCQWVREQTSLCANRTLGTELNYTVISLNLVNTLSFLFFPTEVQDTANSTHYV